MKKFTAICVVVLLLVLVGFVSYVTGYQQGRKTSYSRLCLDIAGASLNTVRASEANPQLREYAKSQFYYYVSKLPGEFYVDMGPVDERLISGLEPFIRHADSPNDYYRKP